MAAGYSPMKLKRKDLEDVSDDFSDFSLSSPARKIRRLDLGLPVILEEREREMAIPFEQSMELGETAIEELPVCDPVNQERAIVLFKPMSNSLVHSPSFLVSSDFITGFKDQLRSRQSTSSILIEDLEDTENASQNKKCLAVIPWAPPQLIGQEDTLTVEVMEAEGTGEAMEIEEDDPIGKTDGQSKESGHMAGGESLHQWQQQLQHCLTPELPRNTATPVVWYQ